jgi:hypothetical protein
MEHRIQWENYMTHDEYDELFIRCAIAEKDLAALRQRIADAPVVAEVSSWWNGGTGFGLCNFKGKRPEPGAKLIIKEDLQK